MERQQRTRPARVPAEINQRDIIALSIRRMDAERRTSAAARVVIDGRKLNGNDAARIGHIKLRHTLPVDPARREVERSEEHTSELQSLMRISYAVFCLKKKKKTNKSIERSTTINTYN